MMTLLNSSRTETKLDALITSAKDDFSKLQQLHNKVEHLRQGIAIESLTPSAQAQLRLLMGAPQHICEVIIQHRILESLAFEGIYERYETVDDAYLKTLRWIFDGTLLDGQPEDGIELRNPSQDEAKRLARKSLLNWMSSGTGIFHVSGKLGSGKSTLMKYLCGHDRTKALLKHWAGKCYSL